MTAPTVQPRSPAPAGGPGFSLESTLENNEIAYYPTCPFPVPEGADRDFLLAQRLGRAHKNIGFDPHANKVSGVVRHSDAQAERLRALFADFSKNATAWLSANAPRYPQAWQLDRVSFRPEEEATRKLRLTARNDLLHVDAFPSRPTNGHRILRLFVNLNPTEMRVWATSDPFPKLLEKFGEEVGLPKSSTSTWGWRLRESVVGLFRPNKPRRSVYDAFMLRFHDFMKANDEWQQKCSKKLWKFPPGSMWLVFTDSVSHAALRGRFAVEHSYFVAPEALLHPELAPASLLLRACGRPVLNAA